MDRVNIKPARLRGRVEIPPSKSIAHRAIIAAFLSGKRCRIENISLSDEIRAIISCAETMGASCKYSKKQRCLTVLRKRGMELSDRKVFDCGESESTLYFIMSIALAQGLSCRFTGLERLTEPLGSYIKILEDKGIRCRFKNGVLEMDGKLDAGKYVIDASLNSQFVTGLLIALSTLSDDSELMLEGRSVSRAYIDLTLSVMSHFGVEIENRDYKSFIIKGNQKYTARDYVVEGDFSLGAFFLTAGVLGCDVECCGLKNDSLQEERKIIDILKQMGADVEVSENKICAKYTTDLKGITVDADEVPCLVPPIAALMCFCRGESCIVNVKRLRLKESDRIGAMISELGKLGADITETDDGLRIVGRQVLYGATVSSWNDHRVAMALAIAACRCEGNVKITTASAVKKSYPDFFENYKELGGIVTEAGQGKNAGGVIL